MAYPSPPAAPSKLGPIVVAVSGVVLLLAFVAMPLVGVGPLSLTAVDVAGFVSQEPTLGLLWLVLVAALGLVAIGAWLAFGTATSGARRGGAVGALVLAGLAVIVYVLVYALAADAIGGGGSRRGGPSAASLFGAGYWIALLAAIAAAVGAVIAMTTAKVPGPRAGY